MGHVWPFQEFQGVLHGLLRRNRTSGGRMAYFFRVVASLLLLCVSSLGSAFPVNDVWSISTTLGCVTKTVNVTSQPLSVVGAAVVSAANSSGCTNNSYSLAGVNQATGLISVGCSGPAACTFTKQATRVGNACPANATATGATCTCNANFYEPSSAPGTCVPSPTCPAGQSVFAGNGQCYPTCTPPATQSVSVTGAFNGCLVPGDSQEAKCANAKGKTENYYSSPAPAVNSQVCASVGGNAGCAIDISWSSSVTAGGVKTLYGTGVVGGKTCAQAAADNAAASPQKPPPVASDAAGAPAPTPCKPGTLPGSVNGVTSCYPSGSASPVGSTDTTTKTNPDGSTTTTTKETDCTGATCTTKTTTTSTPAGGGSSSTTTTTEAQPQQSFCEENPQASVCKSGSFSGSCTGGFSCDGDALQCSIAREQHTRNCQMFDKAIPESTLYDTEKVKTGDQTTELPGNTSVALSAASFSQAPVFASQGLSDLSLTVAGKAVIVEMTRLNQWLEILGLIAVAVTSLVCVRVVFGAA